MTSLEKILADLSDRKLKGLYKWLDKRTGNNLATLAAIECEMNRRGCEYHRINKKNHK